MIAFITMNDLSCQVVAILVTLACSCRYFICCVDLSRDLLSYACSYATCLYNLEGHLAALFGLARLPEKRKKERKKATDELGLHHSGRFVLLSPDSEP